LPGTVCGGAVTPTATIGLLTVASHWVPVASSTFEVVVIVGMAVLIDATLIRGILLPAALVLLGDRAWRLRSPGSDRHIARAGLPPQRA
jgi:RND superfamily putative drug exporter